MARSEGCPKSGFPSCGCFLFSFNLSSLEVTWFGTAGNVLSGGWSGHSLVVAAMGAVLGGLLGRRVCNPLKWRGEPGVRVAQEGDDHDDHDEGGEIDIGTAFFWHCFAVSLVPSRCMLFGRENQLPLFDSVQLGC